MKQETYNGWTNYATWRVNLEIFDGMEFEDFNTMADDAYQFGQDLADYAEEIVLTDIGRQSLAANYALAFLNDVNWTEIASSMIETYNENQNEEV
jgi:hypothetical protein